MSTLEGKSIATTYKDLLQVSNNNIGIDSTIRPIEDGEGTQSALALSTDTVEIRGSIIPSTNSTFDIGSAERKIRHLYLSSNSLYVGDLQFSEQDVQEIKNVRGGAYATSAQGALAETAIQPGAFAFSLLSEIPTTLAGYGIMDAATAAQGAAADTALAKASTALQPGGVSFTDDLTDRPTTIAGYGITDAFNGSFSNLTGRPTSLAGYGITDAATSAQGDKADSALQPGANIPFSNVSDKPTSLAGYGITDAATSAQGDKADSALQPGVNIPWSTVSDKPTSLGGYGILDAATSAQGDKADSALQPDTNIHVNTMHVSGGKIYGPATMYIDPEAIGDNTGKLVVLGDLQVDGVTTTVNSTTVSVSGKTIELAGGATQVSEADGAGVTVASSDASMLYKTVTDSWNFNKQLNVTGNVGVGTTNPAAKLEIQTSSTGQEGIVIRNSLGIITSEIGHLGDDSAFLSIKDKDGNNQCILRNNGDSYLNALEGNVGIGTSSPTSISGYTGATLDNSTDGSFIDLQSNGVTAFRFLTNGSVNNIESRTETPIVFLLNSQDHTNMVEAMRITSDGNVGIGTTNPNAKLEISGGGTGVWLKTNNLTNRADSTMAGQNYINLTDQLPSDENSFEIGPGYINLNRDDSVPINQLSFGMNGTLGAAIEVGGGTPSSPNNQHSLRFKVGRDNQDNKAGIERMRIDSNGNVGIGTTSPDSELHVNDGDSASQIYITSSDNSLAGLYLGDQTRGFRGGVIYNNSTDSLGLWGYAATGFTAQRMTIDSAGNVLVGGSSQSGTANKVMVKSADKFGLSIIDTTAQAIGVGGALNLGGNYRTSGDAQAFTRIAALKDNSADGNFAYSMGFYTTPNGGTFTERMRIDSSGNVGVGTTNPDAKLHVEGHMISSSHKSGLMYTVANSSAYQASQTISVTLPSIAEGNTYHYTVTRHKGAGNRQISTGYISFNGQAGGGIHPLVNTGVADVVISGNTVSVTNNTELAVLKMTFLRVA